MLFRVYVAQRNYMLHYGRKINVQLLHIYYQFYCVWNQNYQNLAGMRLNYLLFTSNILHVLDNNNNNIIQKIDVKSSKLLSFLNSFLFNLSNYGDSRFCKRLSFVYERVGVNSHFIFGV